MTESQKGATGWRPCFSGCTVKNCSCTQANGDWSATTDSSNPANARLVGFFTGNLGDPTKTDSFYARAVRGGPAGPCFGKPDGTTGSLYVRPVRGGRDRSPTVYLGAPASLGAGAPYSLV